MELFIVRHARPVREVVPEGSHADPPLAELGRRQAETTAEFLAGEGIDHVVSSTMRRALETAEPLRAMLGYDIEAIHDLRESDHRSNVYVPAEEMDAEDPAVKPYFEGDFMESVFPDGYETFRDRVVASFEKVIAANRSRKVVVYCHGMVTLVYLQTVIGSEDPFRLRADYCGISRVLASSNGLRSVRSVNEISHVRHLLEG